MQIKSTKLIKNNSDIAIFCFREFAKISHILTAWRSIHTKAGFIVMQCLSLFLPYESGGFTFIFFLIVSWKEVKLEIIILSNPERNQVEVDDLIVIILISFH